LTELQELYLHNNRLQTIGKKTFKTLLKLQILTLHNNQLSSYPVWEVSSLPSLTQLSLADNDWPCDCLTIREMQTLTNIVDSVFCQTQSGKRLRVGSVSVNVTVCRESPVSQTVADGQPETSGDQSLMLPVTVCIITAISLCIITLAFLLIIFRTQVKIWLHSRYNIRLSDDSVHGDCLYDAFLSYSIQDEEYIQQVFVPNLNCQYQQQYRLCLQHRDLTPGGNLCEQWPAVQRLCSSVILVLSRSYLTHHWDQIEVITAGSKCVIVLLEDLTSLDLASVPKLNSILKQNILLRWNQSGFWSNLRFYLPDPRLPDPGIGSLGQLPGSTLSGHHHNRKLLRPAPGVRTLGKQMEWVYDYTDSSTSTRSTVLGSGSPRSNPAAVSGPVMNTEWSDNSDYGYNIHSNPSEHLYAHIPDLVNADHLYHTVEQPQQNQIQSNTGNYLEVMLPSGDIVPATLVRNNKTGRVIPLVSVSPAPGSPSRNTDENPLIRETINRSKYLNR